MEIQEPFKRNACQLFVVCISLYNMVGFQCFCNHPKQVDFPSLYFCLLLSPPSRSPLNDFLVLASFNVCGKHVMMCKWMDANKN